MNIVQQCPNCDATKGIVINYWPESCWIQCTSCSAVGPEAFYKDHGGKKDAVLYVIEKWDKLLDFKTKT